MSILFLTVFLSLCLAVLFMVFFLIDRRDQEKRSPEQNALLPFADETPETEAPASANPSSSASPVNHS